MFLATDSEEK